MSKTTDQFLEEQIGNLGGDEPVSDSLIGKKLKKIPGKKDELSNDDTEELDAFIKRSNERSHLIGQETRQDEPSYFGAPISISQGWIPIDRKEMGFRSQFYPEDWCFYVRPATVEAIKNWSSIDEERIDVVNQVFNDIIRTCVSIRSASGNIAWNKINSWDRFWFVMKIREYTFVKGEAKIEFTDTCSECEEEIRFELNSKSLFYEFPEEETVEKYWNPEERVWRIDPNEYGLEKPVVKLYVPTLEKDQAILDWAISKSRQNKRVDSTMLRFLPWLLSKAPKDEQVFEKFINEAIAIFKSWDIEMFDFMDEVLRNIIINPSEKLRKTCDHCGEEVVSNVQFPNGIKALFRIENKSRKKFGNR